MNGNLSLLCELKERFELDHALWRDKKWDEFQKVSYDNSEWLKGKVCQLGWPSEEMVGKRSELYAWLIVQHSDDIIFQKRCLELIKELPPTSERNQYIAYLTDRILISGNKNQLYGTQFSYGRPYPIEDLANLDERRKNMGLDSRT